MIYAEANIRGGRATLRGGSATLQGSTATLTSSSATLKGSSATLAGGRGTLTGGSGTLKGGSASLVSHYAAALRTIEAEQPTFRRPSQLQSLRPLSQSCVASPDALSTQSPFVQFDVGSHPHLTPRYTQGVLAMTQQHESALSRLSQSASGPGSPHQQCLVRSKQTQPCTLRRQQGILADRHTAIGSMRSSRALCAVDCSGRGRLLSKLTNSTPPALSCCTACGRAYESQVAGIARHTALQKPVGDAGSTLSSSGSPFRSSGRTCRHVSRTCGDGGHSWGSSGTGGTLPQARRLSWREAPQGPSDAWP